MISVRRKRPAGGAESKTSRPRFAAHALALAAALLVVVFCQAVGSPERAGAAPSLRLQKVGNFSQPTYIEGTPAFKRLLYVVEQDGKVVVLRSGHRLSKPLLDISGRVSCCGERGLLSIAFDPRFGRNHLLYAYYTNGQGNIEIDEFRVTSGTRVIPSSRRKVIVIPHPGQSNHNGGALQFGPDGYLYIGTGDGGGTGDTFDNARHLNVLLGKLLRIDPHRRGSRPYTVPGEQPVRGPPMGTARDLLVRAPKPVALLVQPFDRHDCDRRCRAGLQGGARLHEDPTCEGSQLRLAAGGRVTCPSTRTARTPTRIRPSRSSRSLRTRTPPGARSSAGTSSTTPGCRRCGAATSTAISATGSSVASFPSRRSATGDRSTGLRVAVPGSFGEDPSGRIYVASQNGPVYRIKQAP